MTKKHPYFPGLDAVRFFAACLVAIYHFGLASVITPETWFGWVGVEIFFVISGAVIANAANSESAAIFLKSRILRLYPAVWICATISLLLQMAGHSHRTLLMPYIFTLLLIPKLGNLDIVYWTLSVEMAFYGVVFLLLASRRFTLLPALAAFLTLYSGGFVSGLLLFDMHLLPPSMSFSLFFTHATLVDMLLLRHGCLFAVGLWLWLLARHRSPARIAGLAFACLFGLAEISATALESLDPHAGGPPGLWAPAAIWLAAVAMIAVSLFRPHQRPIPVLRNIGLMTYPLYLVHFSLGNAVLAALGGFSMLAFVTALGLSLGLAWLVSHYGEPAIRALLRPLLDRVGGARRD